MDGETLARVGYLAIILVALGGWVLVEFRQRMGQALRMAMAWGLIFVGIIAGYGLWSDIRQDILPMQELAADGSVEVPRAEDGHYYLTLTINGTAVPFMVDTGATGMVLAGVDADRLGIDPESLSYLGEAFDGERGGADRAGDAAHGRTGAVPQPGLPGLCDRGGAGSVAFGDGLSGAVPDGVFRRKADTAAVDVHSGQICNFLHLQGFAGSR